MGLGVAQVFQGKCQIFSHSQEILIVASYTARGEFSMMPCQSTPQKPAGGPPLSHPPGEILHLQWVLEGSGPQSDNPALLGMLGRP